MKKVAIVTDNNAGMYAGQTEEGIFIVPMPVMINDEEYFEGVNLTVDEFYAALSADKKVSTSQPSPGDVMEVWNKVLESYDELVFIPMSSGLSRTYDTAVMLSGEYNGRVEVADAKKISSTMKRAVMDAYYMAQEGLSAKEIKETLEKHALDSSIYIMVDTLKYLKKGGRISPAVAAFGTLLHIKPVLTIQGDKLDSFAKVMNVIQAKKKMIEAIKKDIETRFLDDYKDKKLAISVVHGNNIQKAEEFKKDVLKEFPDIEFSGIEELSLSVACHIGPGSLAITLTKKLS